MLFIIFYLFTILQFYAKYASTLSSLYNFAVLVNPIPKNPIFRQDVYSQIKPAYYTYIIDILSYSNLICVYNSKRI